MSIPKTADAIAEAAKYAAGRVCTSIPLSELSQFARTELSGKRRASKGTEFAKAAPARDPPPAEPAEAAAASGSNGADAEQAPTPPQTADVEAG